MDNRVKTEQIEEAYRLLETRGPATAYDYMQRSGGFSSFPLQLMTMVRQRIITFQWEKQQTRSDYRYGARA